MTASQNIVEQELPLSFLTQVPIVECQDEDSSHAGDEQLRPT